MSADYQASNGGIGFFGLLTIVFIALKLTKVINWSWWLVLLPAYGGLLLILAIVLIGAVYVAISTAIDSVRRK